MILESQFCQQIINLCLVDVNIFLFFGLISGPFNRLLLGLVAISLLAGVSPNNC